MFLVCCLGNHGDIYKKNRHNAGYLFADFFQEKYGFDKWLKKENYKYSCGILDDEKVIIIKPETYMNLSGEALIKAISFYKIPVENIVVIFDDISLPFGKIRIRKDGSSGGHNGLKNIEMMLNTKNYKRIKIGVGSPDRNMDLKDYVLGNFTEEELKELHNNIFIRVEEALKLIIKNDIIQAMNKFN